MLKIKIETYIYFTIPIQINNTIKKYTFQHEYMFNLDSGMLFLYDIVFMELYAIFAILQFHLRGNARMWHKIQSLRDLIR